jgi:D-alanyl-D-alanine carboxypeptidase (penicillin-binding protein 5/6)
MSKLLIALCLILFLPGSLLASQPPQEHSQYAVLMDAATGQILWGRGENVHREMASTTKMMTALLLLEHGHLNDIVTAPPGIEKLPESSLHLSQGETLTLHDLLYAMLLRSANDTAVAGADYLSGSVPAFVALMNQKAKQIGCDNTHFVTPNGLYAPGHYSTASDLARIAAYALATQPVFDQIVRTQNDKITRSIHIHDEWMHNTSSTFLKMFPGADGVKTGYISKAGHCFVGSATRHGWRLIAVALDSNSCREDVEAILNYGYANFLPSPVVRQGMPLGTLVVPTAAAPVPVQAGQEIRVAVLKLKPHPALQIHVQPLSVSPSGPITVGELIGTVVVSHVGKTLATGPVVASQAMRMAPAAFIHTPDGHFRWIVPTVLAVIVGVPALWVAGGMIYGTTAKNARRRRRRL